MVITRTPIHWLNYLNCFFFFLGSYMYIETSLPRRYGENAKLEFSVSSSDIGKLSCLKFYYHMYGETINTLNVYNGNNKTFNQSRNQGDVWVKANITMILENKVSCLRMITMFVNLGFLIQWAESKGERIVKWPFCN